MRKKLPAILIGGALSSGKSRLINRLRSLIPKSSAVLCLESGRTELLGNRAFSYSPRRRRLDPSWSEDFLVALEKSPVDLIFIELAGSEPPESIIDYLMDKGLSLQVRRLIVLQRGDRLNLLDSELAPPLVGQIRAADSLVFLGKGSETALKKRMDRIGFGGRLFYFNSPDELPAAEDEQLEKLIRNRRKTRHLVAGPVPFLLILSGLGLLTLVFYRQAYSPWNDFLLAATAMVLQALPFLLFGVLLSAFVQVYVSRQRVRLLFGSGGLRSYLLPLVAGFILPVCDCASVPVFGL